MLIEVPSIFASFHVVCAVVGINPEFGNCLRPTEVEVRIKTAKTGNAGKVVLSPGK